MGFRFTIALRYEIFRASLSPKGSNLQVSSLKCGLMPLTQESCLVGKVSYHENFGPEVDADKVQRDLGVHNKVLVTIRLNNSN